MQNYRRSEYTSEEKRVIVDYIIKCKCYNTLRGNVFWQEMESRQILQRTWQSLKEHFKKKIVDNIHTFDIPEKEKCLIRDGWNTSRVVKQEGDRRVKRPRYNSVTNKGDDSYNISDESDSSSSTYHNPNSRKKIKLKKKNVPPKDPSEFNHFSDEEEYLINIPPRRNMVVNEDSSNCDSPDLLYNNRQMTAASSSTTNDHRIQNRPTSSKTIEEPTTSRLNLQKKNNTVEPIPIDSDSDDATVINLDLGLVNKINDNSGNNPIEKFSLEEDMSLINFIRVDKTYLQRKNQISIYNYYHEIYPHSKSPEQLMDRFLNHIFPNICTYDKLKLNEMTQFYKDAGVDIPDNLRALLKKSNLNTIPQKKPISDTPSENSTKSQKHFVMNICEHTLNRKDLNCMYCHMVLKGKSHIFISDLSGKRNKDKLANLLSKKFKIKPKYIHHTNFVSEILLEQIIRFQKTIHSQFVDIFKENLQDCCTDSDIETVVTSLEICVQRFSSGDEESSSDSSDESITINSQQSMNIEEFDPRENSTPRRIDSQNEEIASLNKEIKVENISCNAMLAVSSDHDYILKIRDPLEIQDDLCSNSSNTGNINASMSDLEIVSEDELENLTELQEICIKSEPSVNESEYLESVPSQESENIRNTIIRMTDETIHMNNPEEIPASTESFYTAECFSQNL